MAKATAKAARLLGSCFEAFRQPRFASPVTCQSMLSLFYIAFDKALLLVPASMIPCKDYSQL